MKQRPDIFIKSISFSNNAPEEGETITITASVGLLGVVNVTDAFDVAFVLDTEDGEQIGLDSVPGGNLSIGGNYNVTTTWTATSGTHTIYAIADSTNVVEESEEKNAGYDDIYVKAVDDSSDVTSMVMIIAVVLLSVGSVGYIYRDSLFSK